MLKINDISINDRKNKICFSPPATRVGDTSPEASMFIKVSCIEKYVWMSKITFNEKKINAMIIDIREKCLLIFEIGIRVLLCIGNDERPKLRKVYTCPSG